MTPTIARMLPISVHNFMLLVGVIEVIAAVIVAVRPRIGAYVVAAWLWAIIINLLLIPGYFDIALRDFGLSLGPSLSRASALNSTAAPCSIPRSNRPLKWKPGERTFLSPGLP